MSDGFQKMAERSINVPHKTQACLPIQRRRWVNVRRTPNEKEDERTNTFQPVRIVPSYCHITFFSSVWFALLCASFDHGKNIWRIRSIESIPIHFPPAISVYRAHTHSLLVVVYNRNSTSLLRLLLLV